MKRYRLLKDLPGSNADEIFRPMGGENKNFYISETPCSLHSTVTYGRNVVEGNPNWFEEVKEEPKGVFDGIERYQETSGQLAERICGGMTASEALKQINNSVGFKPQGDQVRRKARAYRWPLGRKDEWGVTNTLWSEHEAKFQRRCSASDDTHAYEWPALPDKDGYYPGPK